MIGSHPESDALSGRILQALGQVAPQGMSMPRLCKQLGVGASAALRCLSALGDQPVGGVPGPGWTQLREEGGRWTVTLTAAGQQALAQSVGGDGAGQVDAGQP